VLEPVFRRFGWSPQQVRRVRGVLQVHVGDQVYALKKVAIPADEMKRIQSMLQTVIAREYPYLLPFVHTVDEEEGVETDTGYWIAQEWTGTAVKRGDALPQADVIRGLARFHRLTLPIVAGKKASVQHLNPSETERRQAFETRLEEWRSVAEKRTFPSPFDKSFQRHLPFVQKALSFSLQGMKRWIQSEGGEAPRYTWIHGRIHPQNVVAKEDGAPTSPEKGSWAWIDWEHARIDSPVRDVACFLRRMVPMDRDEVMDPFALLAEYEEEFPLNGKEKRLLSIHLSFPEQPLKLINQYYSGQRDDEGTLVRRLEEEVDRLELFQDWVRKHWAKKPSKKTKAKPLAGIRAASPRSR
jgi:spore coat protein YsxE